MPMEPGQKIVAALVVPRNVAAGAAAPLAGAFAEEPSLTIIVDPFAAGSLSSALKAADGLSYTHVMIWTERPLDPRRMAELLIVAATNPHAIVLSTEATGATVGASHRLQRMLVRLECGVRLEEPLGPCLFPLDLLVVIRTRSINLTELLVRGVWAGCAVVQIRSPQGEISVASGRGAIADGASLGVGAPWRHARLIGRALSVVPHRRYHAGAAESASLSWHNVVKWLNPLAAWRELRQGGASRNELATGLAVGAFVGNMPAWGFHTAIGLYVARRLHLNPLAVVTGTHVSTPPIGFALIAAALWVGHILTHGRAPTWASVFPRSKPVLLDALPLLLDWTAGAVVVGAAIAVLTYFLSNLLLQVFQRSRTGAEL